MPKIDVTPGDDDAVLREVWDTSEIEAKTDLNLLQIEQINKLSTMATVLQNSLLRGHLQNYMILLKSKERKSMAEFVAVVKAKREDFVEKGKGFFGSMFG